MTVVKYGEWLPDLPDFNSTGATVADNVLPGRESYTSLGAVAPITDAMSARMRGGIAARNKSGTVYNYAGNETKLYSVSANVHGDVTNTGGAYALGNEENWEFIKWGETIIGTCINENPQVITFAGANFADLSGSPPKARHITSINNFVVLANIDDGTLRPQRVVWSAINDSTDWTPSSTTQSDFQDLISDSHSGGGRITAITGGEYGNVFQETTLWKMTYQGTPLIFSFDEVLPGVGCLSGSSVTQEGRLTHFLSQEGFAQLRDGAQVEYIGKDKIDKYFFTRFNARYPERVVGASDPTNSIVSWIYPGIDSTDGTPTESLHYNWYSKKWTHATFDSDWIYSALGQGYTLEQLDAVSSSLDTLNPSLDNRAWLGGVLQLAVYGTDNKKGTFGGTALSGVIETPEVQLSETGGRSMITSLRPLVDGAATTTLQVGSRNLQSGSVTWTTAEAPNTETGLVQPRADGRFQRVRTTTTGSFSHATGIDITSKPSGVR